VESSEWSVVRGRRWQVRKIPMVTALSVAGVLIAAGSAAALNAAVLGELPHVNSVLVKGSRFMKMERVVESITAHSRQQEQDPKETGHAA